MLEKFIQELLFRYDLVIIPGFGGIITRKRSAKYNRKISFFSPPYKDISFNGNLTENDGLLVNYVASKLNISHNNAYEIIKQQVDVWLNSLKQNNKLVIENIGIFNWINNRIVFQPLLTKNYLPEAYGLKSFIRKNQGLKQNIQTKHKNKHIMEDNFFEPLQDEEEQVSSSNIMKYAAIAIIGLALVGGGAYYFIGGSHSNPDENYQKASFVINKDSVPNPEDRNMQQTEQNNEKSTTAQDSISESTEEVADSISVADQENADVATESESDDNTETDQEQTSGVTSNTESATEESSSSNSEDLSQKKYQIIIGAFKNVENAQKKVDQLQQQGYQAAITGQNSMGLHMVAIDGSDDFEDARQKLNQLVSAYPGAWIYKK